MVTAPLLTQGIDVDLPKSDAADLSQNVEPLVLSIRRDGTLFLQRQQVELDQLVPKVKAIRRNRPKLPIYIRGDGKVAYARVARVMGLLAKAGIDKVGLITEPDQH